MLQSGKKRNSLCENKELTLKENLMNLKTKIDSLERNPRVRNKTESY